MAEAATTCCGVLSLLTGVELICLLYLMGCITVIANISSVVPAVILGVEMGPFSQVLYGAWALIGIPVTVGAGVAALYRIEWHLRLFYQYAVGTVILNFGWWGNLLVQGSLCSTLVAKDVQRLGSSFVCGFTDTFLVFWMLVFGVVSIYFIYIIWSCAEEIRCMAHPELLGYSKALQGDQVPFWLPDAQPRMIGPPAGGAGPPMMGQPPPNMMMGPGGPPPYGMMPPKTMGPGMMGPGMGPGMGNFGGPPPYGSVGPGPMMR